MISINYTSTGSLLLSHLGLIVRQMSSFGSGKGKKGVAEKWEWPSKRKNDRIMRESKSVYMSGISQEAFVV